MKQRRKKMRDSIYKFTLDIHEYASQVQIVAKQNDSSRKMLVTLMENGKPYAIESGCTAVFMMRKPDGTILLNDCDIIDSGNAIQYEFTTQTTATEGICECEIRIIGEDETVITSPRFTILVNENVYDDGQVESQDEFTALTDALSKIAEIRTLASEAAESASSAAEDAETAHEYLVETESFRDEFMDAKNAAVSASEIAVLSASNAQTSEQNASDSEANALAYKTSAHTSELNAKASEDNAKTSEDNAKTSENNASSSAANANASALNAYASASSALSSETNAASSAYTANENKKLAQSYAVGGTGERPNESNDNAKYYKEQCEQIASSMQGGFIPMGTVLFANLPTNATSGWMYNVSDEFISDSRFKDGGGKKYASGTNVYLTADGLWDCLSGSVPTVNGKVGNIITLDGRDLLLDGYSKASAESAIAVTDNIANALGKLEKKADDTKASVTSLENRVDTAETSITNLENRVDATETAITNLEGRVGTAETEIDTISNDISELQEQLDGISIRALKKSVYDAMPSHDPNTLYVFLPE